MTVSLAGRTAEPLPQAAPVRRGGFGGAEGLASYLGEEKIDVLIDATHPYAAAISANVARAAVSAGVKLIALRRPPWRKVAGDDWIEVENVEAAVAALGPAPKRVFLGLGRNELLLQFGRPGRVGEVAGRDHADALEAGPIGEMFEVEIPTGRARVFGVDVEVGVEAHG